MSLEDDSSKTNEIEDKSMKVPAKPNFPQKRKRRPRPKDYPKRPLSAYNIFFKETREEIIANAKDPDAADFQNMARQIAARWKDLGEEEKERVKRLAEEDMLKYREKVKLYEEKAMKERLQEAGRLREEAEAAKKVEEATKSVEAERLAKLQKLEENMRNRQLLEENIRKRKVEEAMATTQLEQLREQERAGLLRERVGVPGITGAGAVGGGLETELLRMRLMQELRATELRALELRQMLARLDPGSMGLRLQQAASLSREPPVSEYELLLRHHAAAGTGLAQANGIPSADLMNLSNISNLGRGGDLDPSLVLQGLAGLPPQDRPK